MKLNDLDKSPVKAITKTLKEHFDVKFQVEALSYAKTKEMLKKVRGLVSEAKQSPDFYKSSTNPKYMQLVFMEQALSKHFASMSMHQPRIVVENEEVEKSQVVLAAQDMVDTVQKMVEQASDMLVKELPALVDSIQSEIGVSESEQFNQQASESLTALQGALAQAKTGLQSALNVVTGQGGGMLGAAGMEQPEMGDEMSIDSEEEIVEPEAELPELPVEEPEEEPVAGAGRARR